MSFVEQRRTKRFEVQQEVWVTRDGTEAAGVSHNMSLGGLKLRVELQPAAKVGDRITVKVKIPQLSDPLVAEAEVRWIDGADESVLGVQFVSGLRAKQTWALGMFLESVGKAG